MNNKIIIAIDAMGGENAPSKNIEGIAIYLKKNSKKKKRLEPKIEIGSDLDETLRSHHRLTKFMGQIMVRRSENGK